MAATYYTLLTNIGQAKIANAIALGNQVAWTHMAVGDGNGNPTTPSQTQTALVRERYRAPINQLSIDPSNPNYMVAEMIVPTTVGGWTVYEVGIFDAEGDMIAVANFPATYKPELAEGSGRDLVVRIIVEVSNASVVTLRVDPAIVLASQAWVAANYVKKATVAGGTTGQVLAKKSNANEDFQWVDPSAAVSVNVNALREIQTLAADQVVVTLAERTTAGLAVYIEGARLIERQDWTATGATQLTLAKSYPPGTKLHCYQNDPFSTLTDPTETVRGLPLIATQAEVNAGTDDARAVTPKKLRFGIQAVFNADAGFIAFPSWLFGVVVQWGTGSIPAGSNESVTSWPVAFPNGNPMSCVITHNGSASVSYGVGLLTATNFTAYKVYTYSDLARFRFIAIGR